MLIGVFYTRYASEIESDPVGEYTRATMVLEELGIDPDDVTVDDFRYVPTCISNVSVTQDHFKFSAV